MTRFFTLFSIFLSSLASACSPVSLLNATVSSKGYTLHKDIAYGKHPRQKLDVYVPDQLAPNASVIVFYYGGRWTSGDKGDFLFVGEALASRHFITVIADYRLNPEVYYPDFMVDTANAFKWTHEHISDFGGNPDNLFVAGHSSGAYNAVMLTVNEKFIKEAGGGRAWIRGTIGISGPSDFLPFTDEDIIRTFSKTPDEQTQPINFVTTAQPPMLLVTGGDDETVQPKNSYRLADKVRPFGSPVEVKTYEGVGHIGIILSLARGFRYKSPLLDDVSAFVLEHSRPQRRFAASESY